MIYTLRPYQRQAVDALWASLGTMQRPMIVAPTGSGKSVILAAICQEWLEADPDVRIVVATHVKELVDQNAGKLEAMIADVGVHSAGLGRRDTRNRVIVGGVQSLINRVPELGPRQVVIVDEAHRIPRNGEGQYQQLLQALGAEYLIGLTATPYRTGEGELHRGPGALFQGIAYDIKMRVLIDAGHLAPLRPRRTAARFAIENARVLAGDFVLDEIREALEDEGVLGAIVSEWLVVARERKASLWFCATIDQARQVLALISAAGKSAELITGATPADERAATIARFKGGRLDALINVMVLTTGFDAPNVDCMVVLRPTASTGLYVQIMGRGMRPAPGKVDCLVMDFGRNVERHGPVDEVTVNTKRSGGDPLVSEGARMKYCDACGAANALAARRCSECDAEFPVKLERQPSPLELLSLGQPVDLDVTGVNVAWHTSAAGNDCVRIDYYATPDIDTEPPSCYREFFAVSKEYPIKKLIARFGMNAEEQAAETWLEATEMVLRRRWPTVIRVAREGKYHRVIDCTLEDVPVEEMDFEETPF